MTEPDYKTLLIKYMRLIAEVEGIDYLGETSASLKGFLSEQEWSDLKWCSKQADLLE